MEWVETTGRSVEEAKEVALDRLGVDEPEAEFEVLEEAKAGLFGRVRREARVRARIRPTQPRAKEDRRDRRRRRPKGSRAGARGGRDGAPTRERPSSNGERVAANDGGEEAPATPDQRSSEGPDRSGSGRRRRGGRGRGGSARSRSEAAGASAGRASDGNEPAGASRPGGDGDVSEVSLREQGEMVQEFLDGLVDVFDLDGDVRLEEIDDEMIEVQVEGDDLGLLIGPKGQTLAAVQELARTVVQRRAEGNPRGRFRIDVSGYRQRRREALERFARSVADDVKESGVAKALEPMNAADRKIVHDTINELDGVATTSEGEEPRRRVVIQPAS